MKGEVIEVHSIPSTPKALDVHSPPVSAPPSRLESPSVTRSPWTPRFSMGTPLTSPLKKAAVSVKGYLEEVGHLTKLDPQDAWLPLTESRNGNAYYSAFHTLSSGIGFQALVLPVAFTVLGWMGGTLCLSLAFIWQLYTLWLLIQLHESVPGTRYSRYLQLAKAVFGAKLGKCLALFPTMYLSAGTCSALIIVGGSSMKLFFEIVCGPECNSKPLTGIEWCLVFICLAVILAQLPNLNSIAGVSLIGSVMAVTYCSIIWIVSVSKGRQQQGEGASYDTVKTKSDFDRMLSTLNALGIISFAFRGHNLVLEIQGTMPSTIKHPSRIPMWRGVKAAYTVIALCLFPLALAGYWAYGNQIPSKGILAALYAFHSKDTSRVLLGLTSLLVIINCLTSFQIYAMPVFDNLESGYTRKNNRPCPRWLRSGIRVFFGSVAFLIAVALPFLADLAGLLGGIALPVTLAYPCFMWILIKKPNRYSAMWYLNWGLGSLGMGLSVVLIIGGLWRIVETGIKLRFFKPQ